MTENVKYNACKMGQTGTKVATKIVNSFSFSGAVDADELDESGQRALARFQGSAPLVYSRRG